MWSVDHQLTHKPVPERVQLPIRQGDGNASQWALQGQDGLTIMEMSKSPGLAEGPFGSRPSSGFCNEEDGGVYRDLYRVVKSCAVPLCRPIHARAQVATSDREQVGPDRHIIELEGVFWCRRRTGLAAVLRSRRRLGRRTLACARLRGTGCLLG